MSTPIHGLSADELLEWDWLYYLVHLQLAVSTGLPIATITSGWNEDSLERVPDALRLAIRLTRGLAEAHSESCARRGTICAPPSPPPKTTTTSRACS
ncbi:MAG: hypothetical protein WDM88_07755 [Galbitalea sp.]